MTNLMPQAMPATSQLNPLTFPLWGSRLIEASAGTGKTFTLALLYVRLVLGHGTKETQFNRPLTPKDILVVTFTDAAAEELRDRIRNRLVEAAAYFRDGAANASDDAVAIGEANDPLELLRQDYPPKQWNTCAWQLQMAAEGMDEARISTIHSWCNRVLVEQAFDTRGLFNRQLVTDTEDLLAQAVRDYWRVHFYPLDEMAAGLISDELKSPAELLTAIRNLLKASSQGVTFKGEVLKVTDLTPHLAAQGAYQQAKDEAAQAFAIEAEKRQAFEVEVKAHWVNNWQAVKAHLLELRSSLNARSHKSGSEADYLKLLGEIYAWAANNAEQPSLLKNFAAGEFKFLKNKPFQQENSLEAFQLLKDLLEQAQPAAINIEQPELPLKAAVLSHALPWVKTEFTKRMKQRAEMGFDDLLIELDKALDPELAQDSAQHLATALKERFPVAMIDEFQDTDPIQYRIFDRVYQLKANAADSGLFMIGDPKQAIYSFRGADIYTYLQARTATKGRHYTLKKNFRSIQGVVKACNALFNQAESYDRAAFRFKEESGANPIPFIAVKAQGRDEQLYLPSGEAAPLTFWHFSPEEDEDQSLAITRYRELAAESAASEIVDWLMAAKQGKAGFGTDKQITQPLKPADIAILVRTGTEAKAVREALQARQVPSVYLSDRESLFSSQEAQDVLHWLYACANPLDERLVKAALGTNSLDLPLEQLAGWQEDELAWEAQMDVFQQLHWQWQRQGVLVTLQQLLQHYQLPARLMQTPEGERHLTNLLHLAEWLQEASVELDGEQALIRHLAEYLDAGDQQQLLRLESDAERVKVITIHKSKGLEYPLVLLPFIGSWRDIDGKTRQVTYQLTTGSYQEVAGKDAFGKAWEAANDARISEDMRLLYVALTRASHALWLGVAPLKSGNAKKPQVERSAFGYLLNGGQPLADATAYEEALKQLAETSLHIVCQAAPVIHTRLLALDDAVVLDTARAAPNLKDLTNWWIASYSAIQFQSVAGQAADRIQPTQLEVLPTTSQDMDTNTAQDEQREEEGQVLVSVLEQQKATQALDPMSATNVMHYFPAGPTWGTLLHSVLEWAAIQEYTPTEGKKVKGFEAVVTENIASKAAFERFCKRRRIEKFFEPLWGWLVNFVHQKWQLDALGEDAEGKAISFSLSDLKPSQLAVELEFMLESHRVNTVTLDKIVRAQTLNQVSRPVAKPNFLNGLLKGFIDLVAEHDGRYYVIDWKSNRLGRSDTDYTQEAMLKQILEHRYDMQYVLYLVALHRQLKARLPEYNYDLHVGGAIYVFLRGMNDQLSAGLFCDKPPKALIEELDALLAGSNQNQQGAAS